MAMDLILSFDDNEQQKLADNIDIMFPGRFDKDGVALFTKPEWGKEVLKRFLKQVYKDTIKKNYATPDFDLTIT